ncbi:hypothetical protein [Chamaesiphon sp.]|uniref:hypothetical protein n=1 Tax=Chamaesiphon sp. TaxID=2814140 RepID=UPI0035944894
MSNTNIGITKAEFWALADAADITYELIDNYLTGGVLQVWIVDPIAKSITVFYADRTRSDILS